MTITILEAIAVACNGLYEHSMKRERERERSTPPEHWLQHSARGQLIIRAAAAATATTVAAAAAAAITVVAAADAAAATAVVATTVAVAAVLLHHSSPIDPVVFQQHSNEIRAIRDRDPHHYPQQGVQLVGYPLGQLGSASLRVLRL